MISAGVLLLDGAERGEPCLRQGTGGAQLHRRDRGHLRAPDSGPAPGGDGPPRGKTPRKTRNPGATESRRNTQPAGIKRGIILKEFCVRRLKKWHIRVPDFKVQVLGFGVGYPGISTGPLGSAKVAV